MAAKSKDISLEALRGIAALVVVMNHAIDGFLPRYYAGLDPTHLGGALQGNVLYVLINGSAAVTFFFVLSAYILTRRFCLSGDTTILLKGAVKRWPRLAGPVFVAVMASYLLYFFHLNHYEEAGARSGSEWLSASAGALRQPGGGPPLTAAVIHWQDALLQGLFLTFFRGDWRFGSSLWTMKFEFIGSFIAFGLAPILREARNYTSYLVIGIAAMAIAILYFAYFIRPEMAAFPVGVAMAVLLPRDGRLSRAIVFPAILLGLFLMGYPGDPLGAYAIFKGPVQLGMPFAYPQIAGATILIWAVEMSPDIRRLLSGRFAAFLGGLSFPIYLLHTLVIASVASWVYLRAGVGPAFATVFVVSVIASLPLMKFNDWWVGRVNALANRMVRPKGAALPVAGPSEAGLAPQAAGPV